MKKENLTIFLFLFVNLKSNTIMKKPHCKGMQKMVIVKIDLLKNC
jgi:hypothetical protein